MNTENFATNGIHLMPDNKLVMRIECDRIWVDPDVAVDEAAQKVINVLEAYIVNMVQREVAAEREACAKVCEDMDVKYEGHFVRASLIAAAIRARGQG